VIDPEGAPGARTGEDRRRAALADRLSSAALHIVRRVRREDREFGQSSARLSALSTLVNRGPTTLSDLAAIEHVRPPTLTRLVQGLERDGLVVRRPARDDARVSVVASTSKAWKLLEDVRDRRMGVLERGLKNLSPDDLRTLERAAGLLERLSTV
jgi:DNA-binding MarR family transcriptional regulator